MLAGLSYIYYGHADSIMSYFVGLTLVTICINGAAYIGGGNLVTQWFPKKKGLANGYTTMGTQPGLRPVRTSDRRFDRLHGHGKGA